VSTVPVVPAPVIPPAPKLTSIQIIEQEIQGFIKQREQAIANVHAVEGAIQAGTHLLGKLKAEAAKAVDGAKVVVETVAEDAAKVVDAVIEKL